jgi:phosphoribosylanthranilate isomerase
VCHKNPRFSEILSPPAEYSAGVHRVRVKIEGLWEPQTALRVAELGADAVGVVFAASPRRVTPELARQIVAALPPTVASVGVFVNAAPEEINRTIDQTGIRHVQLHGDEPPETVARIRAPCIKAFRVRDERWAHQVKAWLEGIPAPPGPGASGMGMTPNESRENASEGVFAPSRVTVLLDAYDPAVRGGSGRRFNWELIARARERGEMDGIGPIILAGGLDASCVGEAIRVARPWAVDVASGVESAPGVKDLGKVRAFLDAVRAEKP